MSYQNNWYPILLPGCRRQQAVGSGRMINQLMHLLDSRNCLWNVWVGYKSKCLRIVDMVVQQWPVAPAWRHIAEFN